MACDHSTVLSEILETLKEIQKNSIWSEKENEPQHNKPARKQLPEPLRHEMIGDVPTGTECERQGCTYIYQGGGRAQETCFYHPGFHASVETDNAWFCWTYSCCKQLLDMSIDRGCQMAEKHLFLTKPHSTTDRPNQGETYDVPHLPILRFPRSIPLMYLVPLDSVAYKGSASQAIVEDYASLARLQNSDAWNVETTAKRIATIRYLNWRTPDQNSPLRNNRQLIDQLGDAWKIPQDGRILLQIEREHLEQLDQNALASTCQTLANFGAEMKRSRFLKFKIIDRYSSWNEAQFHIGGNAKITGSCVIRLKKDTVDLKGQWRRLILCQGLTMITKPSKELIDGLGAKPTIFAPFLRWDDHNIVTMQALADHISCRPRTAPNESHEKTNPYKNASHSAFHITFFHLLQATDDLGKLREEKQGMWNHGPLYGREDKLLCESALTMTMVHGIASMINTSLHMVDGSVPLEPATEWTVMLLSPAGVFTKEFLRYEISVDVPLHKFCLTVLAEAFDKLETSWREIRGHLEFILDDRNTIMNPANHDKLLWDDENFSRSRKYFWAINALGQFLQSISVNIQEWESFQSAVITPCVEAKLIDYWVVTSLNSIEVKIVEMKNIRSYFATQLESTTALRDGLFNASAVIESRASTRLGENVKLLTFVSIFFLPLAFCTSLWSMNDMWSTRILSYTIVLVGLSTYFVVFNLNNIVAHLSKAYQPTRHRCVNDMKQPKYKQKDSGPGFWSERGENLDLFTPKHENIKPSEWWIFIFLFANVWARLKVFGRKKKRDIWKGESPSHVRHSSDSVSEAAESGGTSDEEKLSTIPSFSSSRGTPAARHESEPVGAEIQEHHKSLRVSGDGSSALSISEKLPNNRIRGSIHTALKMMRQENGPSKHLQQDSRREKPSTEIDPQNNVVSDSFPKHLDAHQELKTVAQRLSGILRRKQDHSLSVGRGDQEIV